MLEWVLIAIAVAAGGGGDAGDRSGSGAATAAIDVPGGPYRAEDQTPSGKFTTAGEVRPILGMTKANWVALREYDGQDLLYVTHLMAWRCGLHELRYAVNGGPMQVWPMPPCLEGTAQPNAIRTEGGLPFVAFGLGEVQSVRVELLYDDLSEDSHEVLRQDVLMP